MKIVIDTADLDCERIDGTRVYIQNVLKYLGGLAPEDDFFLLHKNKYNKLLEPAKFENYYNKSIPSKIWWTQLRFAREVKKLGTDVVWMPIQQIPWLNLINWRFNRVIVADKLKNKKAEEGGQLSNFKFKILNFKSIFNDLIFNDKKDTLKEGIKKGSLVSGFKRSNRREKYIITIHDLAFKFFPKYFPLVDRLKLNFYTDIAVRRADKIIAISESTKNDIIKLYPKINSEKIVVVQHGFDRENFTQEFNDKEEKELMIKYKLWNKNKNRRSNYLLYVGAIQPRKDLVTLIEAFEELKKGSDGQKLKLALVGEVAWKSEKTMEAVENSEFREDIIVTGRVDFKELAMFFRWAKVFVFPSLYEGFGIPVLEAMASRTPVIVANNSSLSEVGGEAVLKFRSGSSKELAEKLSKLLINRNLEKEMIKRGVERIKEFSWEKCAKETSNVLKNL